MKKILAFIDTGVEISFSPLLKNGTMEIKISYLSTRSIVNLDYENMRDLSIHLVKLMEEYKRWK